MNRRQWIIKAATECFSELGYKATSVDTVAKRAGVGKGTIYIYFHNKEELLQVIMLRLVENLKISLEKNIVEDAPFYENAQRVLKDFLFFQKKHLLAMKLLQEARELGTPEVAEILAEIEARVIDLLKKYLQRAIQKGEIVDCDCDLTAFLTYQMYFSLVSEWEKRHKPLSDEEISHAFELFFCRGLEK